MLNISCEQKINSEGLENDYQNSDISSIKPGPENSIPSSATGSNNSDSNDVHQPDTGGSNNGTIPPNNGIIKTEGSSTTPKSDISNARSNYTVSPGVLNGSPDYFRSSISIRESDKLRVNKLVSDLMKFTLSLVLFFYSIIMYYRSIRLLYEVKNKKSNHLEHWIILPLLCIAAIWWYFWLQESQGLILLLTSFCLVASTLPYLMASLNFTNSIYAIRKSENDSPFLSSESLASLIFSLVAFTANIFKIILFINEGK